MDDQQFEEYTRSMKEMFRSKGWEYFINDIRNGVPNVNSVEVTKDAEDLFFRKGQLAVMANILNLEAQLDGVIEQREQESTEEEEAA
ncbi:MAG: hypothetical protein VW715_15245 [Rhodospirillales bacterium]|jgi:hypothetical protein